MTNEELVRPPKSDLTKIILEYSVNSAISIITFPKSSILVKKTLIVCLN